MSEVTENIFFFTGSHLPKLEGVLRRWVVQFTEKHGDYNLSVLDAEDDALAIGTILQHLTAPPFLADKRLVVLKNFPYSPEKKVSKDKEVVEEKILQVLGTLPKSSVVVFYAPKPDMRRKVAKEVEKAATVKKIEWNEYEKEQMIYEMVKGVTDAGTRSFLQTYLANDPKVVASELEKLVHYADGKKLTQEEIEEVTNPGLEESVFVLLDAVAGKNTKQALFRAKRILQSGEDIFALFAMLVWQFEQLFALKELLQQKKSDSEIQKITGMKPFPMQKNKQMLPKYSLEMLKKSMELLYRFDIKIKTGIIKTTQEEGESFASEFTGLIVELTLL